MQTHNVKWKISLSNGETVYEGKGAFEEIEGELSPWQKLLRYTAKEKLLITALSLFTDDGKTFHVPSAGTNPKFRQFDLAPKPISYRMFRSIVRELDKGAMKPKEWFTVAEAIYKDYSLQLWVDENNPQNCWTLVVNN